MAGLPRAPVGRNAGLITLYAALPPCHRTHKKARALRWLQQPRWSTTMSHSTGIETNGVEQIPADQRDASPLEL
ncbi:hypothetical protein, partial [Pseudomonas putida]|uniref:hypothetical protein n=1 Tax=Pseudomonas putida TaxID=303 RepID=UPI001110286F